MLLFGTVVGATAGEMHQNSLVNWFSAGRGRETLIFRVWKYQCYKYFHQATNTLIASLKSFEHLKRAPGINTRQQKASLSACDHRAAALECEPQCPFLEWP